MFGEMVVIEELLQGEELSVCDWCDVVLLLFGMIAVLLQTHPGSLFQISNAFFVLFAL